MKEIERFVCAGVYVWYYLISGVQMLSMESGVREAVPSMGFGLGEVIEGGMDVIISSEMFLSEAIEGEFFAKLSSFGMVAVPFRAVVMSHDRDIVAVPFRVVVH
jgi:hypothetical protein